MDYIHFQDDNDEDEDGIQSDSSEDSVERRNEIESRLYSIIHHNDLSHSLPPELSKRFAIDYSENGEIIVSVNEDLDETKKDIIFNKINLIQSWNQSVDSDTDDGKEKDSIVENKLENEEYKENVENISHAHREHISTDSDKTKIRNTSVLQACGISNSVENEITNSSVLHRYENRIESSCMLKPSDWKANAKMEYISFKNNSKNSDKTEISVVSNDTSINKVITDPHKEKMVTGTPKSKIVPDTTKRKITLDSHNEMISDISKRKMVADTPKNKIATDTPQIETVAKLTQCQSSKLEFSDDDNIDDRIHAIKNQLRKNNRLIRNRNISRRKYFILYRKLKRLNKELKMMEEWKMKCDSTTTISVDIKQQNFTMKTNDTNNVCDNNNIDGTFTNVPSVSDECIIVDTDSELESDLSGMLKKSGVSNKLDSVNCASSDDIICNFIKPKKESDIIILESSGDEQNDLNNEHHKVRFKHKKLSLLDTPKKWTKRMIKFYCKASKEKRNFDCLKLIKDMRSK